MATKPLILLTNDDGIDAPGINALRRALLDDDYRIIVSAPMYEKSGSGCALSLQDEISVEPRRDDSGEIWGYAVGGTPADCVKMAFSAFKIKPDLVLSGINRGMNIGNSVFYSGTVAGAIEASFYGALSMATSLACWGYKEEFYDDAAKKVRDLVPWLLKQKPIPRRFWNFNLPNIRYGKMKNVRLCDHGTSFFMDDFQLYRQEDNLQVYKNVGTTMRECVTCKNSEEKALEAGDCSLTLLTTHLESQAAEGLLSDLKNYTGISDSLKA